MGRLCKYRQFWVVLRPGQLTLLSLGCISSWVLRTPVPPPMPLHGGLPRAQPQTLLSSPYVAAWGSSRRPRSTSGKAWRTRSTQVRPPPAPYLPQLEADRSLLSSRPIGSSDYQISTSGYTFTFNCCCASCILVGGHFCSPCLEFESHSLRA